LPTRHGVIHFNGFATIILPTQPIDEFSFQPFEFDCVSHAGSISLDLGQMLSAKPGLRIMLVQLRYGFLSGISITFLKDAYGPFIGAIKPGRLIVAVFIPAVKDISVKFIPL
jgi:hypothetical protein